MQVKIPLQSGEMNQLSECIMTSLPTSQRAQYDVKQTENWLTAGAKDFPTTR